MTLIDHIRAAEDLLERELPDEPTGLEIALRAQAHATLALAHAEYERDLELVIRPPASESTPDHEEAPTR